MKKQALLARGLSIAVATSVAVVTAGTLVAARVVHASSPCYFSVFKDPNPVVVSLDDGDTVNEYLEIWQIRGAASQGCTAWSGHAYGDAIAEVSWFTVNGTLLSDVSPNNNSITVQAWPTDQGEHDSNFSYGNFWNDAADYYYTGDDPTQTDTSSGYFDSSLGNFIGGQGNACGVAVSDGYGHPAGGGAAHTRYEDLDGNINTTSGHIYSIGDYGGNLGCAAGG